MYEITYYLYTMKDCSSCEKARAYLSNNNIHYIERKIDNPLIEIGTKYLFNNKVYAPFLFHPEKGLYIFNLNENSPSLIKVKLDK